MPVLADFTIGRYSDGVLTVYMAPPVPVGAWNIQFQTTKRFGGGSGLITKSVSSGYNGVSGITITNSGIGVLNVNINSNDTSGLNYGVYAFTLSRLDSGLVSQISEGYLIVTP